MMGIEFIQIWLRNFMSYGNIGTTVKLNHVGSTLIVGEDLDNTGGGKRTNGVGKSTLINAIMYSIYDRALNSSKVDDLVNNINKRHMEIVLVFRKGSTFYKIHRARKMKVGASGNWVKLYRREGDMNFTAEDEVSKDGSRNTNEEIEHIVGMPADMFMRIVVVTANHTPFLDLPANHPTQPCQSQFIARLFNLTRLGDKALALKAQMKETDQQLTMQKNLLTMHDNEVAKHKQLIKSTQTRMINWERDLERDIAELEAKLKQVGTVDLVEQKRVRDEIQIVKRELNALSQESESIQRTLKRSVSKSRQLLSEHTSLSDSTCPYCKQGYHDEERLNDINKQADEMAKEVDDMMTRLEEIKPRHDELSTQLKELETQLLVDNIDELIELSNKSTELTTKLEGLKKSVNPYVEAYDDLLAQKPEEFDTTELNKLEYKQQHQTILYKLLTSKDSFIRKKFIGKYIPFLNGRLETYLEDMGMPHKVCFTKDMTAEIHAFGREIPFHNLSNGQKARVNFALSLAFRDVVQKMHTPINMCLFDEVLDYGLDTAGVDDAAKLLRRKASTENLCMYVITHKDVSENTFSRIMTVQMEKGFSRIVDPNIA